VNLISIFEWPLYEVGGCFACAFECVAADVTTGSSADEDYETPASEDGDDLSDTGRDGVPVYGYAALFACIHVLGRTCAVLCYIQDDFRVRVGWRRCVLQ
jgi:hypothetical protein